MTRGTFVYRNGKIVPKHKAGPRNGGKSVHVISDDLGADLEHMAYGDGRRTSSKSQFRAWTKAAGCFEKGNDREAPRQSAPDSREMARDVAKAIDMCRQGYKPTIGREW